MTRHGPVLLWIASICGEKQTKSACKCNIAVLYYIREHDTMTDKEWARVHSFVVGEGICIPLAAAMKEKEREVMRI